MFLGGTGTHKSQVGKSGEGETGVQTDSGEAGCQGNINNNKKWNSPSYVEAKKLKSLTLHSHGCLRIA